MTSGALTGASVLSNYVIHCLFWRVLHVVFPLLYRTTRGVFWNVLASSYRILKYRIHTFCLRTTIDLNFENWNLRCLYVAFRLISRFFPESMQACDLGGFDRCIRAELGLG